MGIKGKKSIFGKFAVLVLVAVLVSALVLLSGCGGGKGTPSGSDDEAGPEASIAGYYAIYSFTMDGETYDAEELEEFGVDYYVLLNEDGTMEVNTEDLFQGTWEDGYLYYTLEGEDVFDEFVVENGFLTIDVSDEDSEGIFVFKLTDRNAGTSGSDTEEDDPSAESSDVEAFFSQGELEEIKDRLSESYKSRELSEMDYEEVRDTFFDGVEGTINVDTENVTTYQWYATDNDEAFVEVSFHTDEPGSEDRKPDGIRSYLP